MLRCTKKRMKVVMNANLFPLAREGWRYVALSFFALVLFSLFGWTLFALGALGSTLFFLYSFRNPEREITSFQDASVLSPSDGKVTAIEELKESSLYAYKIEIESDCRDVGILRVPMDATLKHSKICRGTRVSPKSPLFRDLNEYAELTFGDEQHSVQVVHRLKRSVVGLFIHAKEGSTLRQSSRYGFMLNGITTLYLPHNFRINVKTGENLRASESLIGYFSN